MQNDKLLFSTKFETSEVCVFPTRVEFTVGKGMVVVPFEQLISVNASPEESHITLEVAGGKKYKIPCDNKLETVAAIQNAQSQFLNSGSYLMVNDLSELARLRDDGVISDEEYKRQESKLIG